MTDTPKIKMPSQEWLDRKIATDPDAECEAGPDMTPTIIQSDRDAAAEWFRLTNRLGIDHTGEAFTAALQDGSYDGDRHPLVQAFATYRTQIEREVRERCAGIAERWGRTRLPSIGVASDCIAAAIRADEGDGK